MIATLTVRKRGDAWASRGGTGQPMSPAVAAETNMKLASTDQCPSTGQAFATLSMAQRRYLLGWSEAARPSGIDAIEDLTMRPWPDGEADAVIGIFQSGHLLATWLVVGKSGSWAVACCRDVTVSSPVANLADALQLVCPVAPLLSLS